MNYQVDLGSRHEFDRTLRSNVQKGEGALSNITSTSSVAWFPFDIDMVKTGPSPILNRNLTFVNGVSSEGLAIIQPRYRIWIPNKLLRGIWNCNLIIFIAILLSFSFGVAMWICEYRHNEIFHTRNGPFTGLYWSFVTMTTVGYGDVVPITFLGRSIAVVWMFTGLMIASVLTATLTNVVTGIEGLGIDGRSVAVMKDSQVERIVEQDHGATAVLCNTYEDALRLVRLGEVYAAAFPYDVAAWMQKEIRSDVEPQLTILYVLEGKVSFDLLFDKNAFPGSEELLECMFTRSRYDVVATALDVFRRRLSTETIYYGDVIEILTMNVPLQVVMGISLFMLLSSMCASTLLKKQKRVDHRRGGKKQEIDEFLRDISILMKNYQHVLDQDGTTMKEVV